MQLIHGKYDLTSPQADGRRSTVSFDQCNECRCVPGQRQSDDRPRRALFVRESRDWRKLICVCIITKQERWRW